MGVSKLKTGFSGKEWPFFERKSPLPIESIFSIQYCELEIT